MPNRRKQAAAPRRSSAAPGGIASSNGKPSGGAAEPSLQGYPRPMLHRSQWQNLDGAWEFAIDAEALWTHPEDFQPTHKIRVPFAPETKSSGVGDTGFYKAVWYRRTFEAPPIEGGRLLLHFGAVDYKARLWVNGRLACEHEGGYTPFYADITELLNRQDNAPGANARGSSLSQQTIVVRAYDNPHDLSQPRGKQDWELQPHSIWYPRTTGIWQTVWLERVPPTWISYIKWTPNVQRWEIGVEVWLEGQKRDDLELRLKLTQAEHQLAADTYAVVGQQVHRKIALSEPGIDDFRNDLLWTPDRPRLIDAGLELCDRQGHVLDRVQSYAGLRSVSIQGDRIIFNNRPLQLRLALDQGYWPDSGLTPPDDQALKRDVELARAMGFNGVRMHQKIECPRFLYWADKLGLLVTGEMPSPYRFTRESVNRLTREWSSAIERDISHPCIIAWVPFNESWGVPDLPDSPAQRHWLRAIYYLTKTLDPTRPVISNDGWESVATDVIGIHDYDAQPARLGRRYGNGETLPQLLKTERPGGRNLVVEQDVYSGQPVLLTEFGGIALSQAQGSWGYSRAEDAEILAAQYAALLEIARNSPVFSGFCYTQFTDCYQETNGLLTMDRTPKFPLEEIAIATRGPTSEAERQVEAGWRRRLMVYQRHQQEAMDRDPYEDAAKNSLKRRRQKARRA